MDDLVGDSHDDESDSYTKQDGCGATNGAKVSGDDMKDVETSVVAQVEDTKLAREIVLENKFELLEDKEDPSNASTNVEHMDAIGNPEENEGSSEKCQLVSENDIARGSQQLEVEDPSDAATDGEHMDAVGNPDENEGTNAKEPISHVLNAPVDNEDVLMKNAHETINHADPPSHESEITSPCGSERKGDRLDGEKANQIILTYELDVLASKDTVKVEVSSKPKSLIPGLDKITAKYRKIKVVKKLKRAPSTSNRRQSKRHKQEDVTKLCASKRNKKTGTLVQDFMPVIGNDGKEIKLDPWIKALIRDSKGTKTRIHVFKEVLDFFNEAQKPCYYFPWGTGFAIEEIFCQCLVAKDANRKGLYSYNNNAHWFLAEFKIMTGVVTFYDTLCGLEPGQEENRDWWLSLRKMMIEQLPRGMSKHGIFNKKYIDPKRYNITFEFSNCAPIQAGLYGDCGVWVCIMMYRLANGLSMDFLLNLMLHPD
ncbi:phospholipase-like protein [Tanacetum coccineum]